MKINKVTEKLYLFRFLSILFRYFIGNRHFSIRDLNYSYVNLEELTIDSYAETMELITDYQSKWFNENKIQGFVNHLIIKQQFRKVLDKSRIVVNFLTSKGYFVESNNIRNKISEILPEIMDFLSPELTIRLVIDSPELIIPLKKSVIEINSIRFNWYCNLFFNSSNILINPSYPIFHNKVFRKLINNKFIVLVGPGFLSPVDFESICTSEVVILINHQSFDSTYKELKGELLHKRIVTYFSGGRHLEIDESTFISTLNEVDFAVFSDKNIKYRVPALLRNKIKGLRNNEMLVEYGYWNFAQYVIMDLLEYFPRHIKVVGIDLYASSIPYSENYQIYHKSDLMADIRRHDPITQFSFLQFLWKNGLISPSENLGKILSNRDNFVDLMQKKFGSDSKSS